MNASGARSKVAPGLAAAQMAIAGRALNSCGKRIKTLNLSIPKDMQRLDRLNGLKKTIEQLNGKATICFELVPIQG